MTHPRIELPRYEGPEPTHHGLSWKIYQWGSGTLLGAQRRFDRPRRVSARAAGRARRRRARGQHRARDCTRVGELERRLWKSLGVVQPPRPTAAGPVPVAEMALYVGTYEMRNVSFEI